MGSVDEVTEDPAAAVDALAVTTVTTESASSTRGDTRHEDAVSRREIAYPGGADLDDGADRFVSEDASVGHRRHVTAEYVQIGSADGHGIDRTIASVGS